MQPRTIAHCVVFALFTASTGLYAQQPVPGNAAPKEATGEDPSEAFWLGKHAYESRDYEHAEEQFGRAYALTRDPEVLFDLAQAQRKAGKCERALQSYRQIMRGSPRSPLALRSEKQIADIEATCKLSEPQGTEAKQASESRAKTLQQAPALPTAVTLHLNGFRLASPPKTARPSLGWSAAALTSGLVVGSVAIGLKWWNHNRHDEWRKRDAELAQGFAPGAQAEWLARMRSNDQLGSSINRVDAEALILGVGAGALVTTSVILYYSASRHERQRSHAALDGSFARFGPRGVDITVPW